MNGLENIVKLLKGKICIDIDVDRQHLIPYSNPKEIHDYIKQLIRTLDTPKRWINDLR